MTHILLLAEISKSNFKMKVMPNGLEKYISLNINKKLVLSSSLDRLG